jgi:hypothetical protein
MVRKKNEFPSTYGVPYRLQDSVHTGRKCAFSTSSRPLSVSGVEPCLVCRMALIACAVLWTVQYRVRSTITVPMGNAAECGVVKKGGLSRGERRMWMCIRRPNQRPGGVSTTALCTAPHTPHVLVRRGMYLPCHGGAVRQLVGCPFWESLGIIGDH